MIEPLRRLPSWAACGCRRTDSGRLVVSIHIKGGRGPDCGSAFTKCAACATICAKAASRRKVRKWGSGTPVVAWGSPPAFYRCNPASSALSPDSISGQTAPFPCLALVAGPIAESLGFLIGDPKPRLVAIRYLPTRLAQRLPPFRIAYFEDCASGRERLPTG